MLPEIVIGFFGLEFFGFGLGFFEFGIRVSGIMPSLSGWVLCVVVVVGGEDWEYAPFGLHVA